MRLIASESKAIILDIRSETTFRLSRIGDARHLSEDGVITYLAGRAAKENDPIIVYCAVGIRSLEVAEQLREHGFRNACSIAGGFTGWRVAGRPVMSDSSFSVGQLERYSRNMYLKEIGEAGQIKLMNARVLLVGAGGLASSAALYLAACGVGNRAHQPRRERHRLCGRLSPENVLHITEGFDVVIDASDNFGTKYLLSDACFLSGKPYAFGGAVGFDGQACVFWPKSGGPCMRCLIPKQPDSRLSPSCSEAGVLGTVPGLIGLVQATEVVKLILGIGTEVSTSTTRSIPATAAFLRPDEGQIARCAGRIRA